MRNRGLSSTNILLVGRTSGLPSEANVQSYSSKIAPHLA